MNNADRPIILKLKI